MVSIWVQKDGPPILVIAWICARNLFTGNHCSSVFPSAVPAFSGKSSRIWTFLLGWISSLYLSISSFLFCLPASVSTFSEWEIWVTEFLSHSSKKVIQASGVSNVRDTSFIGDQSLQKLLQLLCSRNMVLLVTFCPIGLRLLRMTCTSTGQNSAHLN